MAAFACFSSSKEKSTAAYKALIQRFRHNAQQELGDNFPTISSASFAYYSSHKNRSTHVYKDYVYHLRKTELNSVCIMLCDNPSSQLKTFIRSIEKVKLLDGVYSSAYYGEIKKIVVGFLSYFTHIIDDVVKKIDKYSNILTEPILIQIIDTHIEISEQNQAAFIREFVPVNSPKDKERYKEIEEKHAIYMVKLRQIREQWAEHRHDKMEAFAKEYFKPSIIKTNEICTFTHTYIAVMLADRLYEIAVSVGETVDRMNTNMRKYNEECTTKTNNLIQDLYEKNKEHLHIHRRERKRSTDAAEVNRKIEVLKDKIEHYGNEETIARLELETRYWMKRLKEFNEIAAVLTKLHLEIEKMKEEEEKFKRLKTTEYPGSKTICFELMGENFTERKLHLEERLVEMSKTLVTFFCVRGTDRILYTDNIGSYYCDEFNHQNYINDFGLKFYHVNCYGDFLENLETDPYYFDENGRYTLVNGEKLHQCAPCTSQYKLGEDGLLKKVTKDCGHAERINVDCRLQMKDLTDVEILPMRDIVDMSGTLDGDTAKYLWDSFGMILPEVLYTLAMTLPKNPIHYMAHILLKRRFEATTTEFRNLRKQADKYRTKVYKERREKTAAESRAWRSKLVKRRKPEESDNSLEWAAYNQQVADWQYVNSLGYYN